MILTPFTDASKLFSLHPLFAAAQQWLSETDLNTLTPGRHNIDGERLFANAEEGHGHDPATRRFESHRRYIDWQLNISGGERFGFCPSAELAISEDLLAENDLAFHATPDFASDCLLPAGWLAVFYPADAHMPSLRLTRDNAQNYRKVVVKILLDA